MLVVDDVLADGLARQESFDTFAEWKRRAHLERTSELAARAACAYVARLAVLVGPSLVASGTVSRIRKVSHEGDALSGAQVDVHDLRCPKGLELSEHLAWVASGHQGRGSKRHQFADETHTHFGEIKPRVRCQHEQNYRADRDVRCCNSEPGMQGTARCWHGERASAGLFRLVGLVLEIADVGLLTDLIERGTTLSLPATRHWVQHTGQVPVHLSLGQNFVTAWALDLCVIIKRLALVVRCASPGQLLITARAHDSWHDSDQSTRQAWCTQV